MIAKTMVAALFAAAVVLPAAEALACGEHAKPAAATTVAQAAKGNRVELSVTEEGFGPTPVKVKKGEPVTLVITRKTDKTCAKEIMIPAYDIEKELPLNQPVEVTFTPTKSGEVKYGCGMGQMIAGVLVVE